MDKIINKGRFAISLSFEEIKPLSSNEIIILGKKCVQGKIGLQKSLQFLHPDELECIELENNHIEAIFVNKSLLFQIGKTLLIKILQDKIFPYMQPESLLRVDVKVKTTYENINIM